FRLFRPALPIRIAPQQSSGWTNYNLAPARRWIIATRFCDSARAPSSHKPHRSHVRKPSPPQFHLSDARCSCLARHRTLPYDHPMAFRILVADKLADEGLESLRASGIDFDVKIGLKEDELANIIGQYDALIVRSGVKVTAKVLASPGKVKAIARA